MSTAVVRPGAGPAPAPGPPGTADGQDAAEGPDAVDGPTAAGQPDAADRSDAAGGFGAGGCYGGAGVPGSPDGSGTARRGPWLPVAAGLTAFAAAATLTAVTWPVAPYRAGVWLPVQAAGVSFLAAGTLLWLRRPANGTGRLLTLVGATWYLGQLQLIDHGAAYAVGFCLYYLSSAVLGHLVLALPGGRVTGTAQRALVALLYLAPLTTQGLRYLVEYPPEPQAWGDPDGSYSIWAPVGSLAMLVLTASVVVVLVRRWSAAGPPARREYALVWLALFVLGMATVAGTVAALGTRSTTVRDTLGVAHAVTMAVVPVAMAAGLLRVRLARLRVAELVMRLDRATSPEQVRQALADALDDASLQVRYSGHKPALPPAQDDPPARGDRLLRPVGDPESPTAVLVLDPALASQRPFVDAVVAAARLALDNARLAADRQAHVAELRSSQARIVLAADAERRRIQRDLHDGVQHDLLALSMLVHRAHEQVERAAALDGQVPALALVARRLPEVVASVRSLAEGIHPPALAELGLPAAVEALAERAPLPVSVEVSDRRWPEPTERAAYFLIAEALTNVYKHARAGHAVVRVGGDDARLVVSVSDDGVGGADGRRGTGLAGLRDRAGALAGTLRVHSPPGGGTTVVAELPCG